MRWDIAAIETPVGTPDSQKAPGESQDLLTRKVASIIRDMIVQDILPPNTKLREKMLIEKLGDQISTSRTPLREALKVLASEGLVRLVPNRGAVVADPDIAEIADMQLVLATMEGLAGELAARRATDQEISEIAATHYEMLAAFHRNDRFTYFKFNQLIHKKLVAATRNTALADLHDKLNSRLYRIRYKGNLRHQDWKEAVQEHELMLRALQRRDGAELARILASHFGTRSELISLSDRGEIADTQQTA
ncbi:GntR family transcriptional regulator [Rhizobium sp. CF142]|uniref:GntR family transcriptional regulator n=1 Tax=Rhizobium sp. CF142 TaxID=1144314 RepID=UPI00026EEB02|nr:GntR family transcriptional regulator [Rhizobium sp. CF142]EJJ31514.1 transcriptional regulator [Rhizobium sp. CF142]